MHAKRYNQQALQHQLLFEGLNSIRDQLVDQHTGMLQSFDRLAEYLQEHVQLVRDISLQQFTDMMRQARAAL